MSERPSISQSNTGSMSGGQQASIGNNNQQTMTTAHSTAPMPSQAEVLQLLAELESLVQAAELPTAEKDKATKYLGAAQAEAEEDEPEKGLIAKNLERATKTLKSADEAVGAGVSIFEKVAPIVRKIAPWLGAAAGALLGML